MGTTQILIIAAVALIGLVPAILAWRMERAERKRDAWKTSRISQTDWHIS